VEPAVLAIYVLFTRDKTVEMRTPLYVRGVSYNFLQAMHFIWPFALLPDKRRVGGSGLRMTQTP
jgi:hypothetical protein